MRARAAYRGGRSRIVRLLFAVCAAFPVCAGAPAQAGESRVLRAVRFGEEGRFTRIVLELDRAAVYRVALGREPPRLFVELPELLWQPRPDPLARPRGLARDIRPAPAPGGGTRVIVELARPAELVARFAIPPSPQNPAWRLVIDLEPEGAARLPPPPVPEVVEPSLPRPRPENLLAFLAPRPSLDRPPVLAAPADGLGNVGRRPVVVLDPGHGGADPGTIGVDGLKEKDVVLQFALELERALLSTGRYAVVLTRRGDEGLGLRERVRIAREAQASVFLSLHADSIHDPAIFGASVYTLSETASDAEAAALAAKENKADILSGTDLSRHDPIVASILIDLAQRDTMNKSVELAQALAEELRKVTPLLRNHRRFAGFAVLKSLEVPSALIELGYLSNPEEAQRLADPLHRKRLAGAVLAAIDRHLAGLK
ncbi:MAG: N-acetylmuramoyl-L-alanine amidase [Geminicoccaceae bacterium]|nr:N-acetylmuramoyl-L-alanine amidase [Geminicoccaceae bacterium]MDW8342765.1 N-acetylmuramoyl-L-alanine amidase [Geminicoccaceae bacterium]